MDLIERQKAIDALADMHCKSDEDGYVWIIRSDAWARIDALPSVTPKQKTGRWIYGEDNPGTGRDGWFCSECEHFEMWDYSADMKSAELNLPNFCPNCGADMRGGEANETDRCGRVLDGCHSQHGLL